MARQVSEDPGTEMPGMVSTDVGILLSLIVRKRWLSLAGISLCLIGVVAGSSTGSVWLGGGLGAIGVALMLIQIPIGVRHDLRALKDSQPKRSP